MYIILSDSKQLLLTPYYMANSIFATPNIDFKSQYISHVSHCKINNLLINIIKYVNNIIYSSSGLQY